MKLAWIAFAWVVYGAVHSLLASFAFKNRIARRWPDAMPAYRMAFNIFAGLSLLPVLWLVYGTESEWLWRWTGAWAWLANGLALAAIAAAMVAGPAYDMNEFLGLRQIRQADHGIEDREGFRISRLHRHVRHPWYSLCLVLLWTRDMNGAFLVSAIAVTLYFILGSRLEENKLIAIHGDAYREYRKRVPGLLPSPWRYLRQLDVDRLMQGSRH